MNVSETALKVDAPAYGGGAIAFHWISAILVALAGGIGLLLGDFPRAAFPVWLTVHATIGLVLLAIVLLRIWWRANHKPPDLPGTIGEFTRRTSHAAHMLIYALLALTPALGLTTFIAHGRKFVFGSLVIGFPFPSTKSVFHPTEVIHVWLAYALLGLAGLHILAALAHHFVLRDGLIARILPRRRATL